MIGVAQFGAIRVPLVNERNVVGVDVRVEAHPARILRIARQTGAQTDFGCIERRGDHRGDRLLRPRARRFVPSVITGLGLDFHALARAGDPELVKLVVPIRFGRVVSNLVAGARVGDCLADGGADVFTGVGTAARQTPRIVRGCRCFPYLSYPVRPYFRGCPSLPGAQDRWLLRRDQRFRSSAAAAA